MGFDLESLKKRRGKTLGLYEKKIAEIEKTKAEKSSSGDPRFWSPTVDKEGRGAAIIRFLPLSKADMELDGEMFPWITQYYRNFSNSVTGKFYNELDLSTIGQKDPVFVHTKPMWEGSKEDKEIARMCRRKTRFISNIIVIKDAANPDNEGKVFLYQYGIKIHEKIMAVMFPDEELSDVVQQIDPTDFWLGANFLLKIENVASYRNYDKSKFLSPSPLFEDGSDDKIAEIWESQHSLLELNDPKHFKSFEDLQARMLSVLSDKSSDTRSAEDLAEKKKESKARKLEQARDLEEDSLDNLVSAVTNDDSVVEDDDIDLSMDTDSDDETDEILKNLLA